MDIDENTLYPLLRRLETQGLLDSEWREEDKRPKRFYRLSSEGPRDPGAAARPVDRPRRVAPPDHHGGTGHDPDRSIPARGQGPPAARPSRTTSSTSSPTASTREFEDEEATRGRPLVEAEEVAILRSFGHPMAVAARYRGDERSVTFGRRLIGPELFPTYTKVLAVNVIITLLIVGHRLVAGGDHLVGRLRHPRAARDPVRDRDRDLRVDRSALDPRPGRLGSADRQLDGPGRRRVDPRRPRRSSCIGKAHTTGRRRHDVRPRDRRAGRRADGLRWQIGLPERIGFMEARTGLARMSTRPAIAVIVCRRCSSPRREPRPAAMDAVPGRARHAFVDLPRSIVIGLVSLALGTWVVLVDPRRPPRHRTSMSLTETSTRSSGSRSRRPSS